MNDERPAYGGVSKQAREVLDAVKENRLLKKRIEEGLKLADEMERRNYSGTMDWYAEQLRETLGGRDEQS